jgi:hypothetical protein
MNGTLVRPCSLDIIDLSAFSIIGNLLPLTRSRFMFLLLRISIPDRVVTLSSGSGSEKGFAIAAEVIEVEYRKHDI